MRALVIGAKDYYRPSSKTIRKFVFFRLEVAPRKTWAPERRARTGHGLLRSETKTLALLTVRVILRPNILACCR